MARDKASLLAAQAKKSPALQALVDSVDDMSVDDLMKVDQPKWIREGLVITKDINRYKAIEAYVLANCKDSENEDFPGDMLRWTGVDTFMEFGRGQLLVREGDLLFVSARGVWIGSSHTMKPDARLSASAMESKCKFSEYKLAVKKNLEARYGHISRDCENSNKPMFTIKHH